jgi:hypothetical protein
LLIVFRIFKFYDVSEDLLLSSDVKEKTILFKWDLKRELAAITIGPNCVGSYQLSHLMTETDPASKTQYNSNIPKRMVKGQHNTMRDHCLKLLEGQEEACVAAICKQQDFLHERRRLYRHCEPIYQ